MFVCLLACCIKPGREPQIRGARRQPCIAPGRIRPAGHKRETKKKRKSPRRATTSQTDQHSITSSTAVPRPLLLLFFSIVPLLLPSPRLLLLSSISSLPLPLPHPCFSQNNVLSIYGHRGYDCRRWLRSKPDDPSLARQPSLLTHLLTHSLIALRSYSHSHSHPQLSPSRRLHTSAPRPIFAPRIPGTTYRPVSHRPSL